MKSLSWAVGLLGGILFVSPAFALSVTESNFDEVAKINFLGGTVQQIKQDGTLGGMLTTASQFVGSPNSLSGVIVTLPGWYFASSSTSFNSGGSSEPDNVASFLYGAPTDLTFTTPGAGGPDGGAGDGSVQLLAGGYVTLRFAQPITALEYATRDLFIFTNTDGNGTAQIDLIDAAGNLISGQSVTSVVPGGSAGSGMGALILDVLDGTVYQGVRLTVQSGAIEVDAVGAYYSGVVVEPPPTAPVPEPATLTLLGTGLAGLGGAAWRRARSPRPRQ